jgi:hypothetical protein
MDTKQYLAMYSIELITSTNNIVLYFIGSNCYQIKGHGNIDELVKKDFINTITATKISK